jgi:hypothetical protein
MYGDLGIGGTHRPGQRAGIPHIALDMPAQKIK